MNPDGRELATRRQQQYAGLAIPVPTAATYDVATEGRTGWRFVLTRRWIAFFVGVIVYAAGCAAGVIWQAQLGQQIATFNATVDRNFDSSVVPITDVMPSIDSYTAAAEWTPVSASGTYLTSKQLFVRNRTCGNDTGFEVLTPFRMSGDRILVVDRGCVDSSSANPNDPSATPAAPAGIVALTARIVTSEPPQGAVSASVAEEPQNADQVDAIDLHQIAPRLGGAVYTGAYGMLVSQSPAPIRTLHRVLTAKPTLDASAQEGAIFGTVLYAIVGLAIFGYALREKFRFVNRFDPRLWAREWKRIQRLAARPYSDAEIEDLLIERSAAGLRQVAPHDALRPAGREVGDGRASIDETFDQNR